MNILQTKNLIIAKSSLAIAASFLLLQGCSDSSNHDKSNKSITINNQSSVNIPTVSSCFKNFEAVAAGKSVNETLSSTNKCTASLNFSNQPHSPLSITISKKGLITSPALGKSSADNGFLDVINSGKALTFTTHSTAKNTFTIINSAPINSENGAYNSSIQLTAGTCFKNGLSIPSSGQARILTFASIKGSCTAQFTFDGTSCAATFTDEKIDKNTFSTDICAGAFKTWSSDAKSSAAKSEITATINTPNDTQVTFAPNSAKGNLAKFEPIKPNSVLLMIGQNIPDIMSYSHTFSPPGGVMMYANITDLTASYKSPTMPISNLSDKSQHQEEYASFLKTLPQGATTTEISSDAYWNKNYPFQNQPYAIQIGLQLGADGGGSNGYKKTLSTMAAQCGSISTKSPYYCTGSPSGDTNTRLANLATLLNNFKGHPIFLRVGYELNWHERNHGTVKTSTDGAYDPENYKKAYTLIRQYLTTRGVNNVAYVLHIIPYGSKEKTDLKQTLASYWPKTGFIGFDWLAFTYLDINHVLHDTDNIPALSQFSEERKIPLMIAESSAQSTTFLKQLLGLFKTYPRIKAWCYINQDWQVYPLWKNNIVGQNFGNTQVQTMAQGLGTWKTNILHSTTPKFLSQKDLGTNYSALNGWPPTDNNLNFKVSSSLPYSLSIFPINSGTSECPRGGCLIEHGNQLVPIKEHRVGIQLNTPTSDLYCNSNNKCDQPCVMFDTTTQKEVPNSLCASGLGSPARWNLQIESIHNNIITISGGDSVENKCGKHSYIGSPCGFVANKS